MDDKYKQLNLLVDKISARLAEAEQENIVLRAKTRALESTVRMLESAQQTAKALKEWKDITTSILRKLYLKIDKEIEKIEAASAAPDIGEK